MKCSQIQGKILIHSVHKTSTRVYTSSMLRGRTQLNSTTLPTNYTDSSLFTVLVVSSSLDIKFHELYWRTIDISPLIATDPDFNVVGCGGR